MSDSRPSDEIAPASTSDAGEPRLSISLLGLKINGSGQAGVRFAFWIALVVCGLAALRMLTAFVG